MDRRCVSFTPPAPPVRCTPLREGQGQVFFPCKTTPAVFIRLRAKSTINRSAQTPDEKMSFASSLFFLIFASVAFMATAQQRGYNPTDPNNCLLETFVSSRRQRGASSLRQGFDPKANPCVPGKFQGSCKSPGTYCQCAWAVSSCGGNRPDCPVSTTCSKCPKGYTCPGTGFAIKNKGAADAEEEA